MHIQSWNKTRFQDLFDHQTYMYTYNPPHLNAVYINAAVKDHLEPPLLKSSPLFTS